MDDEMDRSQQFQSFLADKCGGWFRFIAAPTQTQDLGKECP